METIDEIRALAGATPHAARLSLEALRLIPYAPTSPDTALRSRARRTPNDNAILSDAGTLTWRALDEEVNRYSHFLVNRGVGEDTVVALMMENRAEFLAVFHAINRLGAVAALINTSLSGNALVHAIRVAGARRVVVGSELADRVFAIADEAGLTDSQICVHQDVVGETYKGTTINAAIAGSPISIPRQRKRPSNKATACFIYTSGTTGLPKAAIMKNQRMLGGGMIFGRLMHQARRGDVIYIPLPLYHSNALLLGWCASLATGAAVALRRRFSASQFFADIHRYGATSFVYIGELCRYLLNTAPQPDERSHQLRCCVGNGLRPDIWEDFQKRFNVPVVREFYGSTEGNAFCLNVEGKPGMIGRMPPGQAVVRCDPATGELQRGPDGYCVRVEDGEQGLLIGKIGKLISYDGYVDSNATNAKVLQNVFETGDAWFNTGDLVQLNTGRWLAFADRLGDTFRWKGENVSTTEVGEMINGAEGVREATVYGVRVPNADGRAGMCVLQVDDNFNIKTFANWAKEALAPYQVPRFVRIESGDVRVTGTFKHQKGSYQKEGFDPSLTSDKLYVMTKRGYRVLSKKVFAEINDGTLAIS